MPENVRHVYTCTAYIFLVLFSPSLIRPVTTRQKDEASHTVVNHAPATHDRTQAAKAVTATSGKTGKAEAQRTKFC